MTLTGSDDVRSATAKRSAISCWLVLCSLSHPNLSQSCKLTLVADQEDSRPGHNARKEVVACSKFTAELLGAIDGGIHLAPELALCFREGRRDLLQRDALADNHHIDIACRGFAAAREP